MMISKTSLSQKTLYNYTSMWCLKQSNSLRQKAESWLTGERGRGRGRCLKGRISVLQDEKVGDLLHNNVNGQHCRIIHLKMSKMVNFMICILYRNKKNSYIKVSQIEDNIDTASKKKQWNCYLTILLSECLHKCQHELKNTINKFNSKEVQLTTLFELKIFILSTSNCLSQIYMVLGNPDQG